MLFNWCLVAGLVRVGCLVCGGWVCWLLLLFTVAQLSVWFSFVWLCVLFGYFCLCCVGLTVTYCGCWLQVDGWFALLLTLLIWCSLVMWVQD